VSTEFQLDYSVECENCGKVERVPARYVESEAHKWLADRGWTRINDENHCPECAKNA